MRRGEVWWASLPVPAGRRPVLLLSRDSVYGLRTSITVAPVTRTMRDIPTYVHLGLGDGMPVECVVSLDDIVTVPASALTRQITTLSRDKMDAVDRAIAFALDIRRPHL